MQRPGHRHRGGRRFDRRDHPGCHDSDDATTPTDHVRRRDPRQRPGAARSDRPELGEVLKPLVDDGTITQDQADKVIAAIVAARPAGGPDGGHRGPGGSWWSGGLIGNGLDVVATTLGITTDEVVTALKNGQTLADLAVSKGKTAQDVIDAIVAEATTRINDGGHRRKAHPGAGRQGASPTSPRSPPISSTTSPGAGLRLAVRRPGFGGPGHHGDDDDGDHRHAPSDTTATTDTVAG